MGALLGLFWRLLREHVLAGGPASHACRRGSGCTRGFNFFVLGDSFTRSGVDGTRGLGVGGLIRCAGRPQEWSCGAVPPQERWHPALRRGRRGGVGFCFFFGGCSGVGGGFFHTLGSGWHERVRGGGFNPLRGATTGVVMRRRATSGEMARGGWFLFFLWRLLRCRRGILSHAREWPHEG